MTNSLFAPPEPPVSQTLSPRDYQQESIDNAFRLWDEGHVGELTRLPTGLGKSPVTCWKFARWLERSPEHRCMVVSYEQQLVHQFSEEIKAFLCEEPGIEMGASHLDPNDMPRIVVASRQSLMPHRPATEEQRESLIAYGVPADDIGVLTKRAAKRLLYDLSMGVPVGDVLSTIVRINESIYASQDAGAYGRLYKFDWRKHWLLAFDEDAQDGLPSPSGTAGG